MTNTPSGTAATSNQRRRRAPAVLIAALAVTVIAVGLVVAFILPPRGDTDTFVMRGFLTVSGDTNRQDFLVIGDGTCEGANGGIDLGPNTVTTVTDSSGKQLTTGTLGVGVMQNGDCLFPITVPDTPKSAAEYTIIIGRHTPLYASSTDADAGLELRLPADQ